jgi:hypothetical protein
MVMVTAYFGSAQEVQEMTYRIIKQGATATQKTTVIQKEDQVICSITRSDVPSNRYRLVCDPAYETLSSHVIDAKNGIEFRVNRKGATLYITGKNNGKKVDKTETLPATPFYQNFFFSLRPFITSAQQEITFSTLRPDNLKPYKFKAQKIGKETVTVAGTAYHACKVKVGLTGALAPLFNMVAWFRVSDGVLLKRSDFQKSTIELVSIE